MPNAGRAGVYIGVSGTATCRDFFVFLAALVSWIFLEFYSEFERLDALSAQWCTL